LRALGARVLRGRDFAEADALEAPGVVLINETLAGDIFRMKIRSTSASRWAASSQR